MTEVIVGETESFEGALKRFNKRVQADGILSEARRAEYFEKLPTDDKALVIIPDGGDYAHLQRPRRRIQSAIADFLLAG